MRISRRYRLTTVVVTFWKFVHTFLGKHSLLSRVGRRAIRKKKKKKREITSNRSFHSIPPPSNSFVRHEPNTNDSDAIIAREMDWAAYGEREREKKENRSITSTRKFINRVYPRSVIFLTLGVRIRSNGSDFASEETNNNKRIKDLVFTRACACVCVCVCAWQYILKLGNRAKPAKLKRFKYRRCIPCRICT